MRRLLALALVLNACGKKDRGDDVPSSPEPSDRIQSIDLSFVVPSRDIYKVGEQLSFRVSGHSLLEKVHLIKVAFMREDMLLADRTLVCDARYQGDDNWITDCGIACVDPGKYVISGMTLFAEGDQQFRYTLNWQSGFYFEESSPSRSQTEFKFKPFEIQQAEPCVSG